ncbi:MAG: hypothetical protein QM770_03550 [Tepidisphaeraceae bacterium]
MSFTKTLVVAALAMVGVVSTGSTAKAQMMPNWGVGDLAAMNAQFDANFDVWARQGAWQVALATPNDQPLPFNAMTISQSISDGNNAFAGYIGSVQANSNTALNAVDRWDTYAVQGNGYYQPQYGGGTYVLPYTTQPEGGYNLQNGYVMPGYVDGGNNFYIVPGGEW